MRKTLGSAGLVVGASVGLVATSVLYLSHRMLGVAFAPFDVFEWSTRWLPGAWITGGIDLMVEAITAFGVSPISVAAKAAEKIIAILLFIGGFGLIGVLAGGSMRRVAPVAPSIVGASLFVVIVLVAELELGRASIVGTSWTALVMLGSAVLVAGLLVRVDVSSSVESAERRRFLLGVTALSTAGSAVLVAASAFWKRRKPLARAPSSEPPIGSANLSSEELLPDAGATRPATVHGTRPEITPNERFYRIDIDLQPPQLREADWRLRIDGLVARRLELQLSDLRALPSITQIITLECISNPLGGDLISTSRWTGVRLADVLALAVPAERARTIQIEAADGFYESLALADAADARIMLVYEMNGVPLPPEHGFPLRIYIPDRHGMKQPKWITRLQLTSDDGRGYWVARGWSKEAIVKTTSVIDTVGASMMLGSANIVPIGGMAYAGARGISRVEVQVDDAAWAEATLIAPALGPLTWVLWRYDWAYRPGRHTFRVRAYDGAGSLQPIVERGPHPDGASGIHSLTMTV